MLKHFADQDEDNESDQGARNKRPKRTIDDTPQKQQADSEKEEPYEYKSGSEEEYVPGKLNLREQ